MEEKIEKPIQINLDDFVKENKPSTEVVNEQQPSTIEKPQMVDPESIVLGKPYEGDGTKNRLDEEDVTEEEFGDTSIRISNKEFVIEAVTLQEDLAKKKIATQDFTLSRDGNSKWVQTRMEITYKDSSYKSSLPNIKWFEDKFTGAWSYSFIKIKTHKEYTNKMTSVVSKLYYKYCKQFGFEPGSLSMEGFMKGLVGKKVILIEICEEFNDTTYYRLDVHKFV